MQSLKKIHAWAQIKVPLLNILSMGVCSRTDWYESYMAVTPLTGFLPTRHICKTAMYPKTNNCSRVSFLGQLQMDCEWGTNFLYDDISIWYPFLGGGSVVVDTLFIPLIVCGSLVFGPCFFM